MTHTPNSGTATLNNLIALSSTTRVGTINYTPRLTGLSETQIFSADGVNSFAANIETLFNKWANDLIRFQDGTKLTLQQSISLTDINPSNDQFDANYTLE